MTPQFLIFKKPIKVVQLFRSTHLYGKEEKSFEQRREKFAWKPMRSDSGFVKDEIVYLPESVLANPKFKDFDLIILLDDNIPNPKNVFLTDQKNYFFRRNSAIKLDTFQLKFDLSIDIHLKYNRFEMGDPKREDFKICELKKNLPVEIKINGKIDGRFARMFQEQSYIFEYLGDFTEFALLKNPFPNNTKEVPSERKIIDLNKTLY